MFPFPICPLAGQSIFGKIALVGSFAPLLVSSTSEVAYEPLFVKTYLSPRLTGAIPNGILRLGVVSTPEIAQCWLGDLAI